LRRGTGPRLLIRQSLSPPPPPNLTQRPVQKWQDAPVRRDRLPLNSTIWGIEIFGPLIEQHGEGGHIVSTASIAGLISGESNAYNVSKYGVVALSEGLRRELAPRGIRLSVLCPGFIRTQIMNSRRNLPKRFEGRSVPCRLRAHLPCRSIWSGHASLRHRSHLCR
jgi:NAD(P)-dependent dehydrogenase (short-subunit alcohol dehydrogenase family)